MIRFLGPVGLISFGIWVYAVFDVIATESMLVRNLPKLTWLTIVVFVPAVGAIAWLALGRPLNAGWRPGDTEVRQRRPVRGFEDSDAWQARSQNIKAPAPRPAPPTPERNEKAAHPSSPGDGDGEPPQTRAGESAAVRERRLMEWEADLARREQELGGPDQDPNEPQADDPA